MSRGDSRDSLRQIRRRKARISTCSTYERGRPSRNRTGFQILRHPIEQRYGYIKRRWVVCKSVIVYVQHARTARNSEFPALAAAGVLSRGAQRFQGLIVSFFHAPLYGTVKLRRCYLERHSLPDVSQISVKSAVNDSIARHYEMFAPNECDANTDRFNRAIFQQKFGIAKRNVGRICQYAINRYDKNLLFALKLDITTSTRLTLPMSLKSLKIFFLKAKVYYM